MAQSQQKGNHDRADNRIEEEALKVAKSIQTPGQTKEQTRLIAKGIEKGIALYKHQQSTKARERDKARKKLLKQRNQREVSDDAEIEVGSDGDGLVRTTLMALGLFFVIAAIAHLGRYSLGLDMTIGSMQIAAIWSLPGLLVSGGIGAWLLWLARRVG